MNPGISAGAPGLAADERKVLAPKARRGPAHRFVSIAPILFIFFVAVRPAASGQSTSVDGSAARLSEVGANPPVRVNEASLAKSVPTAPAARVSPLDQVPIRRSSSDAGTGPTPPTGGGTAHPTSNPTLEFSRVAAALGLVLGLILLLRWAGKQFFAAPAGSRSSRAVKVLSRTPYSPRQQLVLVQVGKRVLVLGDGGQQLSPLAEIIDPDEVAALLGQLREDVSATPAKAFVNLFNRARAADFDGPASDETESAGTGRRPSLVPSQETEPSTVAATRAELGSLMERVRLVTRQFERS